MHRVEEGHQLAIDVGVPAGTEDKVEMSIRRKEQGVEMAREQVDELSDIFRVRQRISASVGEEHRESVWNLGEIVRRRSGHSIHLVVPFGAVVKLAESPLPQHCGGHRKKKIYKGED
jgi:hypothetical protein